MRYLLDTHALVWFLAKDKRLSEQVRDVIQDPLATLIVPAIVLAEAKHIADRKRIPVSFGEVLSSITSSPNYTVAPLDIPTIGYLPDNLDIHDALVVATALHVGQLYNDEVVILTMDLRITESPLTKTLW